MNSKIYQKERQDFIDEVAKGKFIYSELGTAKDCYDDAEELWEERERRIEKNSILAQTKYQENGQEKK